MDKLQTTDKDLYKVIFFGNTTNNQDRNSVAKRFAAAFNLRNTNTLKQLFSGKAVTLKKGLSYDQAHRYGEIMAEMGADCCIEPESPNFSFNEQEDLEQQREYEKKKRRQMDLYSHSDLDKLSVNPLTQIHS